MSVIDRIKEWFDICPAGGRHDWYVLESMPSAEFPQGWAVYDKRVCLKCRKTDDRITGYREFKREEAAAAKAKRDQAQQIAQDESEKGAVQPAANQR